MSGNRCWNNFPSKATRDANYYTEKLKSRTLYGYMKGIAKTNGPLPKANGSGKYYGGLYINPNTKCLVHSNSYQEMLDVTKGAYYCTTDVSNINRSFNGEMYEGSTLYSNYDNVDVTSVTSYDVSFGQPVLWLYLVDPSYTGTTYLYWDDTNPYGWPLISYNYNTDISNTSTYIYLEYKTAAEQYMPYLTTGQSGAVFVTSAGGDSKYSLLVITRLSNSSALMHIYLYTGPPPPPPPPTFLEFINFPNDFSVFTYYDSINYTFPYNFISLNLSSKYNYALWPPPFFSYDTEEGLINFPGVVTDPHGQIFSSTCRQPSWLYRKYGEVDISFTYIDSYNYFGDYYGDPSANAAGDPVIKPSKYAIQNALKEELTCFQFPRCLKFD